MEIQNKLMLIWFLSFLCFKTDAQYNDKTTRADSFWNTLPQFNAEKYLKQSEVLNDIAFPSQEEKEQIEKLNLKYFEDREIYCIELRNRGIRFWQNFPKDDRRFDWLLQTLQYAPSYFVNIKEGFEKKYNRSYSILIDTGSYIKWNKTYLGLRREYLQSTKISEAKKKNLILSEIRTELNYQLYPDIRRTSKFDYLAWCNKIIMYANYWYPNVYSQNPTRYERGGVDQFQENVLSLIVSNGVNYGFSNERQKEILNILKSSDIKRIKDYTQTQLVLLTLKEKPFRFRDSSTVGQIVDIDSLRGNVVLVDFWNTKCTPCVQFMPTIKQIYDKYKLHGFRVVSICADPNEKIAARKRAIEIHEKVGADWPMIFLDSYENIYNKYGFVGAPHVLLLDKNGNLVMYNGEIFTRLDSLVSTLIDK